MRRVDERVVGKRQDLRLDRVVEQRAELLGAPAERRAQVGAADVADEERVAGQERVRALGVGLEVVDEDRDRLGRVAGRLERDEPDLAELDRVAVGERRELVLGLRPGAEVDPRADAVAQLEVAGEEVGVEVREEDVLDPAAAALGVGDVLVDVALRVDDGRDAGCLVGDEVRRVGEAAEVVLLEDHRPGILAQPTGAASS